jgi:hypothetical protein
MANDIIQNRPRQALLINYMDNSIISDIRSMDNIWNNNNGR